MSIWKRGRWAWGDFTVHGTRYRIPLKERGKRIAFSEEAGSRNYIKAIQAEEREKVKAERGELSLSARSFS